MSSSFWKMAGWALLLSANAAKAAYFFPWESEVELGFQRLSGNSDSTTLNSRLGVNYTNGPYRHLSEARFLLVEKDNEQDKHKVHLESQANYKYDSKSYVLANIKYLSDKYGPYFKDTTLAIGLGYQAVWQEKLTWLLEIGPGYHYQRPNLDELDDKDLILRHDVREIVIRGQSVFTWQFSETSEIEYRLTAISGKSNTTFENRFSVATDIVEDLAVKLSSSQKYINKVPPGLKNNDAIFTVNLIYSF